MDILGHLLTGGSMQATDFSPTSDFWFEPVGNQSEAGVRIDPDSAQKVSAWYRGRDILATVLAMLPLSLFERLPNNGGSEKASGHPLYDVLHDKPNGWQDSFQWRRQKMYHLIDCGNGYDRIESGGRGAVDQLIPIHPRLVTPKQVLEGPYKGRILYHVRDPRTSTTTTYTQDQIFHLRGASDDGIVGKGILEYARTSLGTALATESYAAQIYSKGTLNGGWIELPGQLLPDAARRLALSLVTKPGEHHMPKPLEQGAKIIQNNMTPEDAQMLLSRKFHVDDIARWLGLPRMMLESSDPSHGNAEQFGKQFLTINMGGWLSLWEFAINGQLITASRKYFVQFNRDAFERADLAARWTAHVAAVNAGITTVDEARAVENYNKRGGKADELREPQNITGKPLAPDPGGDDDPPAKPKPSEPNPEDAPSRRKRGLRAEAIAVESAARVLRKEISAVSALAVRHAADEDAFIAAVSAFYVKHAELVAQTMQITATEAEGYCAGQCAQLMPPKVWYSALDLWRQPQYAEGLAAMVLDEEAA
jgi:HK97 family phage portal protein